MFIVVMLFVPFVFAYTGKVMSGEMGARVDPGIHVFYSEFENQGDTTEFLYLNDTALENIIDMTLEIGATAKLIFLEPINLTRDVVNGSVDLSVGVDLLHNLIFVNSSALTCLQTPAMVFVRSLTFTNPMIFRNGVVCSPEMCSFISYIGGELVFRAENFSTYYIVEDPTVTSPPEDDGDSDGGGGGGGGAVILDNTFLSYSGVMGSIEDLVVSVDSIVIDVRRGSYYRKNITVMNSGTKNLVVGINSEDIGKFIVPEVRILELAPGESRELYFDFYFSDKYPSEVYIGDIIFLGLDGEKRIKTILNVNDAVTLFDVVVDVMLEEYFIGELVSSDIEIVNNGLEESLPFDLIYSIMNEEGDIVVSNSQEFIIDKSLNLVLSLELPYSLDSGSYIFHVRAGNGESFAISSDAFYVYRGGIKDFFKSLDAFELLILNVVLLLVLLIVGVLIKYRRSKLNLKGSDNYNDKHHSRMNVVRKKRVPKLD